MFNVPKALLISSDTVIVRAGGGGHLVEPLCYFVVECYGEVECWGRCFVGYTVHIPIGYTNECVCCACDPSVHLDVPYICYMFVYVYVCRK